MARKKRVAVGLFPLVGAISLVDVFLAFPRDILLSFLTNEIGGNWALLLQKGVGRFGVLEVDCGFFHCLDQWMLLRGRCPRIQFRVYSLKMLR